MNKIRALISKSFSLVGRAWEPTATSCDRCLCKVLKKTQRMEECEVFTEEVTLSCDWRDEWLGGVGKTF